MNVTLGGGQKDAIRMGIMTLQRFVSGTARRNGFWDDAKALPAEYRHFAVSEKLALVNTETAEALEAYREGCPRSKKIGTGNFEEEIADAIIRLLDLCEFTGVNVAEALIQKAEYNETRPYKHGKGF